MALRDAGSFTYWLTHATFSSALRAQNAIAPETLNEGIMKVTTCDDRAVSSFSFLRITHKHTQT